MTGLMSIQGHLDDEHKADWMDMLFRIETADIGDVEVTLTVKTVAAGVPAGFKAVVPRFWKGYTQREDGGLSIDTKRNSVSLRSIGVPTANWVNWMIDWCARNPGEDADAFPIPTERSDGTLQFQLTAAHLGEADIDLASDVSRLKLFYDEDLYWELFFNTDLSRNELVLNEKDPAYREELILSCLQSSETPSLWRKLFRR